MLSTTKYNKNTIKQLTACPNVYFCWLIFVVLVPFFRRDIWIRTNSPMCCMALLFKLCTKHYRRSYEYKAFIRQDYCKSIQGMLTEISYFYDPSGRVYQYVLRFQITTNNPFKIHPNLDINRFIKLNLPMSDTNTVHVIDAFEYLSEVAIYFF